MLISMPVGCVNMNYEVSLLELVLICVSEASVTKKNDMTFEVGLELASNGHLTPTVPLKWKKPSNNQSLLNKLSYIMLKQLAQY